MNEYYYIRYNLYKYFLNIDDDTYDYYLTIIIPILYLSLLLLTLFALLLLQNISGFSVIYIIFLVLFYIITYRLIISIKSISTDETLIKYKNFYELRNIIFKENINGKREYVCAVCKISMNYVILYLKKTLNTP